VARFQNEFGWDRVTSDPMEAAFFQIYLWKLAVEKAGDFAVDKVRDALRRGIEASTAEVPSDLHQARYSPYHTARSIAFAVCSWGRARVSS
jgi:urea transport system substrate-binding protein